MNSFYDLENIISNAIARGGEALAPQNLLNSLDAKKNQLIVSANRLSRNLIGLRSLANAGSNNAKKLFNEGSTLVNRIKWVLDKVDSTKAAADNKVAELGALPALAIAAGAVYGIVQVLDSVNGSILAFNRKAEIELESKKVGVAQDALKAGINPSFMFDKKDGSKFLVYGAATVLALLLLVKLKK